MANAEVDNICSDGGGPVFRGVEGPVGGLEQWRRGYKQDFMETLIYSFGMIPFTHIWTASNLSIFELCPSIRVIDVYPKTLLPVRRYLTAVFVLFILARLHNVENSD